MRQLPLEFIERRFFPHPATVNETDIMSIGTPLTIATLTEAYSLGIFPWPHEDLPLLWCSPDPRGVLEFSKFKTPKSFNKFLHKTDFKIRFNHNFSAVIDACSKAPRPNQSGTWINDDMKQAYIHLHSQQMAHSIEVYKGSELVGGLYGVFIAGVFAGESMFYHKDNASKLALYACVQHLKKMGHTWMDIQMLTPVTEQFGGEYISKIEFLEKLESAQKAYLEPAESSMNHILFPQGAPFSAS